MGEESVCMAIRPGGRGKHLACGTPMVGAFLFSWKMIALVLSFIFYGNTLRVLENIYCLVSWKCMYDTR